MTAHSGQDVEMACSFRGSGSASYSLEIQWWYIRDHKEWTDKETWTTNQVTDANANPLSALHHTWFCSGTLSFLDEPRAHI